MHCILCGFDTTPFYYDENYDRQYLQCQHCKAVLLDTADYISKQEEKERYATHDNDVTNPGYQKFVQPVVDTITSLYGPSSSGLDYGCGPGPVITHLLRQQDYNVETYDPYFDPRPEVLNNTYDYIFCCEVIEHFHHPAKEFEQLKSLLKPDGKLICKTDPYTDDTDFPAWYYKNDETHTIFYHPESFSWIKEHIGFTNLSLNKRQIIFTL